MITKYVLLAGTGLLLAACGNQQTHETYSTEPATIAEGQTTHAMARDTSSKMMKSADITCEVPDVLSHTLKLERMAKDVGGYVQSSLINNEHGYNDARIEVGDSVRTFREHHLSADLVLQIPSDKLDSVMNTIPGGATSVSRRLIAQQDATLDFLANDWRLLQATTDEQHRAGGDQTTTPTNEQMIAAKVQNLSILKKVAYSSVSIHLTQPPIISSTTQLNISSISRPTFVASLITGLQAGTQVLQSFIVAMAYIWPLIFAVTVALSIVYFIRRKMAASAK